MVLALLSALMRGRYRVRILGRKPHVGECAHALFPAAATLVRPFYNTKLHGDAYVGHPTYHADARWDTRRRANATNADRTQIHNFPKTQGSSFVAANRPISQAVASALAHCVVRSTAWTPLLPRRSGLLLDALTRVLCGGSNVEPAALTQLGTHRLSCHRPCSHYFLKRPGYCLWCANISLQRRRTAACRSDFRSTWCRFWKKNFSAMSWSR